MTKQVDVVFLYRQAAPSISIFKGLVAPVQSHPRSRSDWVWLPVYTLPPILTAFIFNKNMNIVKNDLFKIYCELLVFKEF